MQNYDLDLNKFSKINIKDLHRLVYGAKIKSLIFSSLKHLDCLNLYGIKLKFCISLYKFSLNFFDASY